MTSPRDLQVSCPSARSSLASPCGIRYDYLTIGKTIMEEQMPSKVKVTVSLDESLVQELAEVSRRGRKSRSRLVEEALQYWRRSRLEHELKEGYQAMAQEDRATAEQNLRAAWEALSGTRLARRITYLIGPGAPAQTSSTLTPLDPAVSPVLLSPVHLGRIGAQAAPRSRAMHCSSRTYSAVSTDLRTAPPRLNLLHHVLHSVNYRQTTNES